jgi:formylglycine-generating enzyme required for sulfatase activity
MFFSIVVFILCRAIIFVPVFPDDLQKISVNSKSDMVLVEGGTFQMGDVFGDGEDDERPVHEVTLDSYYIGKYQVTVGDFREFVEATGYKTTAELEGGAQIFDGSRMIDDSSACWHHVNFPQDNNHPVVCVSWYDAVEYCNWRSKKEGLRPCYRGKGDQTVCDFQANGYRLPTEAEWEFAARSRGEEYKYAWGNGDPYIDGKPAANIRDETAKTEWGTNVKTWWHGYDDGYLFTSPVGTFAPNDLGLYDFSGNVYEWCWDWYNETYYQRSPSKNPCNNEIDSMRICRNVGYGCLPKSMRTVNRGMAEPDFRFLHGGFRLARSYR